MRRVLSRFILASSVALLASCGGTVRFTRTDGFAGLLPDRSATVRKLNGDSTRYERVRIQGTYLVAYRTIAPRRDSVLIPVDSVRLIDQSELRDDELGTPPAWFFLTVGALLIATFIIVSGLQDWSDFERGKM
jgi:hypothetical protein